MTPCANSHKTRLVLEKGDYEAETYCACGKVRHAFSAPWPARRRLVLRGERDG